MDWLLALGLGYLLGSVPFGLILTNLFGAGNLREIGSGNIGATNVLRTGNKGLAAATLLLDGAKGAAAVLVVAQQWPDCAGLAGLAAMVGHCFPVWLRFRGGKGVATLLGVCLAFDWRIGLASALVWLAVSLLTRISSLGGMASAIAAPATGFLIATIADPGPLEVSRFAWISVSIEVLAPMAVLVIFQHRANIKRLIAGTEPKIGQKSA